MARAHGIGAIIPASPLNVPMIRRRASVSAWKQILNLAAADGWTAVYDPTNPDTRTLREDNGTFYITQIEGGLGNLPALVQAAESRQPQLSVGAFGQLDAMIGDGSKFMSTEAFTTIPLPYAVLVLGRTTDIATAGNRRFFTLSTGNLPVVEHQIDSAEYSMNAGTAVSGGVVDTGRHLITTIWDGSSKIRIDGTEVASGNAGTLGISAVVAMARGDGIARLIGEQSVGLVRSDADMDAINAMEDLLLSLGGVS